MGIPGLWQIALVLVLVLLLFGGRGRISNLMGDVARGIRSFREGLSGEDDDAAGAPMRQVEDVETTDENTTAASEDKSQTPS